MGNQVKGQFSWERDLQESLRKVSCMTKESKVFTNTVLKVMPWSLLYDYQDPYCGYQIEIINSVKKNDNIVTEARVR